ncbi:MAG: hypothetical protein COS94_01450 [Candidatus Hydrogenedentes bacterium CG07_land_8_20_14_0_80_42_17]|nr:MAG: hypothetical protein COS94_01450 [Candidatus Hydrogenedentes bacterium CG07_land_8_20_14_0_80_42_17]
MREESNSKIISHVKPVIISAVKCNYNCKGCPKADAKDGLVVRIVGYNKNTSKLISAFQHRFVELASGNLPTDVETYFELKSCGLNRLIVPLFGLESEHDKLTNEKGSFKKTLKALKAAKKASLESWIITPAGNIKEMAHEHSDNLRRLMRLGWDLHSKLMLYDKVHLPCYAEYFE